MWLITEGYVLYTSFFEALEPIDQLMHINMAVARKHHSIGGNKRECSWRKTGGPGISIHTSDGQQCGDQAPVCFRTAHHYALASRRYSPWLERLYVTASGLLAEVLTQTPNHLSSRLGWLLLWVTTWSCSLTARQLGSPGCQCSYIFKPPDKALSGDIRCHICHSFGLIRDVTMTSSAQYCIMLSTQN